MPSGFVRNEVVSKLGVDSVAGVPVEQEAPPKCSIVKSSDGNRVVVTFVDEDHTLGNFLTQALYSHSAILTAGYTIPHPLERKMILRVERNVPSGNTQPLEQIIAEVMRSTASFVRKTGEVFTSAAAASGVNTRAGAASSGATGALPAAVSADIVDAYADVQM